MIKNPHAWNQFEDRLYAKEAPDYQKGLTIFEALWDEAVALGVLPLRDPLAGLETDIALANILNSCSKKS
ncbi:MAG: hypothetical protein WC891_01095 [Actinomycetota bacterium]